MCIYTHTYIVIFRNSVIVIVVVTVVVVGIASWQNKKATSQVDSNFQHLQEGRPHSPNNVCNKYLLFLKTFSPFP